MVVVGVLVKLWWWCRECFGIGGEGGIVVVLMVTADVRVVVGLLSILQECSFALSKMLSYIPLKMPPW